MSDLPYGRRKKDDVARKTMSQERRCMDSDAILCWIDNPPQIGAALS